MSSQLAEAPASGRSFVIEAGDRTAGIVVGDGHGFHFFASDERFTRLDGAVFRSVAEASRAAARLARQTASATPAAEWRPGPSAGRLSPATLLPA